MDLRAFHNADQVWWSIYAAGETPIENISAAPATRSKHGHRGVLTLSDLTVKEEVLPVLNQAM